MTGTSREQAEARMRWYEKRYGWTGLFVYEDRDHPGVWACDGDGLDEDVRRIEARYETMENDDRAESEKHDRGTDR